MSNLEIRLKNIDETRNYLLDEIEQSDQISSKHEKLYKYLNYIEHIIILVLAVTGCVSISAFASLVCVPIGIRSSAIDIKFVQSLQQSKGRSQLSRKLRKNMKK